MRSARRSGAGDDNGGQIEAGLDGVEGVKDRFLILLEITVVSQGQALDQDHEGRRRR